MSNWNTVEPEDVRRGATIRALRTAYGVPITVLAEKAGISKRYLEFIENGHRKATRQVCGRIAQYLDVPLAAITIEGFEADCAKADGEVA